MRRASHETKKVLHVMLEAPAEETYGFELSQAAGLAAGSVYPILKRLEKEGWITGRRENLEARDGQPGRPRHYYRLTAAGRRAARELLDPQETAALKMLTPGWTGVGAASSGAA